jgi:hypothetical protein
MDWELYVCVHVCVLRPRPHILPISFIRPSTAHHLHHHLHEQQVFSQGRGVPIEQGRALVEKMVAEKQYNEDVWASS